MPSPTTAFDARPEEPRRAASSSRRKGASGRACGAWILALLLGSTPAPAATGFDLTLVRPAQTSETFVAQGDGRSSPAGTFGLTLTQQLTSQPLVLHDPLTGGTGTLVGRRLETTFVARWTPRPRVTLGASLSAIPWQQGEHGDVPLAGASANPAASALGDLGLGLKVGLLGPLATDGLHLVATGDVFLPTGSATAYAGAGGWRARLHLVGSYDTARGSLAMNAGFDRIPRADVPLAGILVDNLWTVGLAGAWNVGPSWSLLAETQASVLFETARRLYPQGLGAALAQAPAYALVGARVMLGRELQGLVALWRGLDRAPGAASLGLMLGLTFRSGGGTAAPPAEALAARATPTSGDEESPPSGDETAEASVDDDETPRRNASPPPETRTRVSESQPSRPSRAEPKPGRAERSAPASVELATRTDDEIRLATPLPWKGRTAKLAAPSVPALRAIATLMKAEPASTRLVITVEAVGSKSADLALARRRALALRGVLSHLGRWAAKRVRAEGVRGSTEDADPSAPPITLHLLTPASAASSPRAPLARETRSEEEGEDETATPAAAPSTSDDDDGSTTAANPPPAGPCWRDGSELRLATPLPWQGRSAKLAAASIPQLRALASAMKDVRGASRLVVSVTASSARPADVKLAKSRAVALKGVLAHLAHWPAKRLAAAVTLPGAETSQVDAQAPPISFHLDEPRAPSRTPRAKPGRR